MRRILNPKSNASAFREISNLLFRHQQLTMEMAKREISDRYAGQVFGLLWTVGHPLFMMGIYVVIFGYVFNMRIGGTVDLPFNYTIYLLSGLIPWFAIQESMSKSSTVITGHANIVKQVVFPIEILPVKVVISTFIPQIISSVLLTLYILFSYGHLPWTFMLLPGVWLLQFYFMIGISFIFSSVGAYFRDLKDFIQLFCVAGMYMLPICFLPSQVPGVLRPLLYCNPFSYLIWCYQDICYYGRFEHPWAWPVMVAASLGVFATGYRIFRKLKIMFGNVL